MSAAGQDRLGPGPAPRPAGCREDGLAEAEQELRLLRAVVRASVPALLVTDGMGVITWVSPGFAEATGFDCVDAIGRRPAELLAAADAQRSILEQAWETARDGEIWRGEVTLRRRDGRSLSVEQIVAPVLDAAGILSHTIWIKRDLSDQKHLQSQLLQYQKMESVGRLAGGIAHDFNNLITAINGTAELASMRLHEGDPLRHDLERIRETGKRAASLTGQLLAFSRRQPMSASVVHVGGVLLGLRDMLGRLLGENVTLDVVAGPDHACVLADRGQLEQVVMNLAINARDAMPNGGTLTIEASITDLDDSYTSTHPGMKPGPHVALVVADTGSGMDEETQLRIFEPFFTTKDAGQGTGLGLATVYGIVKQSNGSIWVYSEIGRGTTFRIYLPLAALDARAAAAPAPLPAAPVTPAQSGLILVVEDEDFLRDLAKRMLETSGYSVLLAESGEEALVMLEERQGRVDLLLTDVVLPGITGRELAEQAEAAYPGLKVVYTSGYTEDVIRRHGLIEGQMPFISKPYTRAGLTRIIRDVLGTD